MPDSVRRKAGCSGAASIFFAQIGHVDVQVMGVFLVPRAPDVAQELAVGNDLAPVLAQQAEEGTLLHR
jgi:hypothetical protein